MYCLAYNDRHIVKRLRVGVLYGGRSSEHEISLASAAAVFANLDRQKYEPIPLKIEKDGRWVLADRPPSATSAAEVIDQMRGDGARVRGGREVILPARPGAGSDTLILLDRREARTRETHGEDVEAVTNVTGLGLDVIFPVLHGPLGEDGTIQGLLELANSPYVGCGVLASAVGMDKAAMKIMFRHHGLRVPDWVVVWRRELQADRAAVRAKIEKALPYPVFVKPANLGSSVGISKVKTSADLDAALDLAASFDRKIIIEAGVPDAREIECAVLGNDDPQVSIAGEVVPINEFYDYDAKYINGGSKTVIPAKLTDKVAADVRRIAKAAFEAIDGSGLARVDFLVTKATNKIYLNEVNTLPGFTTISMYSQLWQASGVDYPTLVDRLVTLAIERHNDKQDVRTSFF
jgi:D-alanine-D-alanine ligase